MNYQRITEGKATILVPHAEKVSKKMGVFYNPIMTFNRDVTIALLNCFPKMRICDPLAATGVRTIRILKETKHREVVANDISEAAYRLMKKNFRLNNVKVDLHHDDANLLLRESTGFHYIDLDVFGNPNFLLDSAIVRLGRRGILAVTATDTSALAGSHLKACLRKYWAMPLHNELMHEVGVRILIRKIQLIGAQYDKALTPMLCFHKDHYYRLFLRCEKGKRDVDDLLAHHDVLWYDEKTMDRGVGCKENSLVAGPMWTGHLVDPTIGKKIKGIGLIKTLVEEDSIGGVGFYDIHKICKQYHFGIPDFSQIMTEIEKRGRKASRTIFCVTGIKTDVSLKELVAIIRLLCAHR